MEPVNNPRVWSKVSNSLWFAFKIMNKESAIKSLANITPEPLRKYTMIRTSFFCAYKYMQSGRYYIKIKSKKYPIKQVVEALTCIPRRKFTAADAYECLFSFGFNSGSSPNSAHYPSVPDGRT